MSRPLRIEYSGAWYHVMNRGRRGDKVFSNEKDRLQFLTLLEEATALWNVKVSAYCLMPNHYHLLLYTPEGNLSRYMRHINGVYTQKYNRAHRCDGQLFRGRYKCILVDKDAYLLQLVRYIHLNPVRAGAVTDIDDFEWSSHRAFISQSKKWAWVYKEKIMKMLSISGGGKRAYLKFIGQEEDSKLCEVLTGARWPAILGGKQFQEWVKNSFYIKKVNTQIPASYKLAPEVETIKVAVCKAYSVSEENLRYSRRSYFNEPRDVAIYLVRMLRKDTLTAISKQFSLSGYSTVSSSFGRVKKKMTDKTFRNKIEVLEGDLLKGQTEI